MATIKGKLDKEDKLVFERFENTLLHCERCERSRRYAAMITEMEKVVTYFETWAMVIDEMGKK
jgi:hypothetical protein